MRRRKRQRSPHLTGSASEVVTASGRKIDTEFEAVELDDLITSDKAEFPKGAPAARPLSAVVGQPGHDHRRQAGPSAVG